MRAAIRACPITTSTTGGDACAYPTCCDIGCRGCKFQSVGWSEGRRSFFFFSFRLFRFGNRLRANYVVFSSSAMAHSGPAAQIGVDLSDIKVKSTWSSNNSRMNYGPTADEIGG